MNQQWVKDNLNPDLGITTAANVYNEWLNLNFGAMYDVVTGVDSVRAVKYRYAKEIGYDMSVMDGRYSVFTNGETSEYIVAIDGYLRRSGRYEDYYEKVWGSKIHRETQILEFFDKDIKDGKEVALKPEDIELLRNLKESNLYGQTGMMEVLAMDALKESIEKNLPLNALCRNITFDLDSGTLITSITILNEETGRNETKTFRYKFNDCREAFGTKYITIEEYAKCITEFAIKRYEDGWYDFDYENSYGTTLRLQAQNELMESGLWNKEGVDRDQLIKEQIIVDDINKVFEDTYKDGRNRNVDVFVEIKDAAITTVSIAALVFALSNPGSAMAVALGITSGTLGIADGSYNIYQGDTVKGTIEIVGGVVAIGGEVYKLANISKVAKVGDVPYQTSYGKSSGNLTEGSLNSIDYIQLSNDLGKKIGADGYKLIDIEESLWLDKASRMQMTRHLFICVQQRRCLQNSLILEVIRPRK